VLLLSENVSKGCGFVRHTLATQIEVVLTLRTHLQTQIKEKGTINTILSLPSQAYSYTSEKVSETKENIKDYTTEKINSTKESVVNTYSG